MNLLGVCAQRENATGALLEANTGTNTANERLFFSPAFVNNHPDISFADGVNYAYDESWGVNSNALWQINADYQLVLISAYRELDFGFGTNLSSTPFLFTQNQVASNQHQVSQEFQLTSSAFNQQLEWVAGLYYFHEDAHMFESPIVGAGLIQPVRDFLNHNESVAIFTHFNLALSEYVSATFGARYSNEHKELNALVGDNNYFPVRRGAPASIYPDPADVTQFYPPGPHELDFSNTTLRAGIEYRPLDDIMLFTSYSQGFKSGG